MTKETYDKIISLCERDFNLNETLSLLQVNKTTRWWSWGVSKVYRIESKGILLRVSGHHHKGYVLVSLSWDDTYSFSLISLQGTIKETITNVYFDELVENIDKKIERIDEYVK